VPNQKLRVRFGGFVMWIYFFHLSCIPWFSDITTLRI